MNFQYKRLECNHWIEITTDSGKYLGKLYQEVDGFYVFDPIPNTSWGVNALSQILDELDSLNKEWEDQISSNFKEGEK